MKKTTITKYVAGKWECWKDEKYSHWYIGETGTNTYLAQTYSEANARLIVAAKEMYELLKFFAYPEEPYTARTVEVSNKVWKLLRHIDGEEAEA